MGKFGIGLTAILLISALAGCQTPYENARTPQSLGVASEPLTSNLYRVRANGNIYDDKAMMVDYVLLKAAETTASKGKGYFTIVQMNDASETLYGVTPSFASTSFSGNSVNTTYTPGMLYASQYPRIQILIEIGGSPNGPVPRGAISAEEIIKTIGPRVLRPKR